MQSKPLFVSLARQLSHDRFVYSRAEHCRRRRRRKRQFAFRPAKSTLLLESKKEKAKKVSRVDENNGLEAFVVINVTSATLIFPALFSFGLATFSRRAAN